MERKIQARDNFVSGEGEDEFHVFRHVSFGLLWHEVCCRLASPFVIRAKLTLLAHEKARYGYRRLAVLLRTRTRLALSKRRSGSARKISISSARRSLRPLLR